MHMYVRLSSSWLAASNKEKNPSPIKEERRMWSLTARTTSRRASASEKIVQLFASHQPKKPTFLVVIKDHRDGSHKIQQSFLAQSNPNNQNNHLPYNKDDTVRCNSNRHRSTFTDPFIGIRPCRFQQQQDPSTATTAWWFFRDDPEPLVVVVDDDIPRDVVRRTGCQSCVDGQQHRPDGGTSRASRQEDRRVTPKAR